MAGDNTDLSCSGYIIGRIEAASQICDAYQYAFEQRKNGEGNWSLEELYGLGAMAKHYGTSADVRDTDAVIQSFINWAERNPREWEYTPDASEWLSELWPCKLY